MMMMMTGGARRCSHCGNNGHNSRTCYDRKGCLKLFGVRISSEMDNHQFHDENVPVKKERNEAIKRSLSMGHLLYHQHLNNHHHHPISNQIDDNADNAHEADVPHHGDDGYLSDGLTQYSYCKPKILRRRKKGVPWTAEEHKTFLIGLKTLGRGDWRGISKNFVHTRTPTQVASHAQKYFMRQLSAKDMKKKKRRMSLFDLPLIGDLSINSPTSPFLSPNQESPPRQVENLMNSSGDSCDHVNIRASTFHAHHSHALPPLSPEGQVFKALPNTSCTNGLNEDLLKLNLLTSVSPKQVDDTKLQLGLPSFASPNTVLASSMLDDMLELRIALPVGLQSK